MFVIRNFTADLFFSSKTHFCMNKEIKRLDVVGAFSLHLSLDLSVTWLLMVLDYQTIA